MNRQVALIATAIFLILAGLAVFFTSRRAPGDAASSAPEATERVDSDAIPQDEEVLAADLYFPGTRGGLRAERHELAVGPGATERIAAVVAALLAGPRNEDLRAPLPSSVSLRRVYLTAEGTAYLDLQSAAGEPPPASGSQREVMTVYSLVNTVLLNFDEAQSLVLLWNGRQLRTFAGHLDTMRPLFPNVDLIAPAP